jgi:hypothetical protein
MKSKRIFTRREHLKDVSKVTAGLIFTIPFISLKQQEEDRKEHVVTKSSRTLDEIHTAIIEIPPVNFLPASDRWLNLPVTYKTLQAPDSRLKIVMLGDSIVNDTFRSDWGRHLQKGYPNCKITTVAVVGNGAGCWYYKKENRINRLVVPEKPDLLIIGGISQSNDIDSIKEVIRQVRDKKWCEVLLITGAFGSVNPYENSEWAYDIPLSEEKYRKRLLKLATEINCGFLDMTAHWGLYIRKSNKPLDWFKRDPIHANARGEQVLGQILAKHLLPVE